DVALDATITIVFSAPMKESSLDGQSVAGACTGSIQVSSDNFATCIGLASVEMIDDYTLVVEPSSAFDSGTIYVIKVTTGAETLKDTPVTYQQPTGFRTVFLCEDSRVVISQIYPNGGMSGSVYDLGYVELHNTGSQPVNLSGWSLQSSDGPGSSGWADNKLDFTSEVIPPYGYILIGTLGGGSSGENLLPSPNTPFNRRIRGAGDKLALVSTQTPLDHGCPSRSDIVDFVQYGSATCLLPVAPGPGTTNTTQAVIRSDSGCANTGDNSLDFALGPPNPRTSYSPGYPCMACSVNEVGLPQEVQYCATQWPYSMVLKVGQESEIVFGRIYHDGLTTPPPKHDDIIAQLGWGPVSVDPTMQSGFQYINASYNAHYGNDAEYAAKLTPTETGSLAFLYRFSIDGGIHWTYCDLNDGNSGGDSGSGSDPNKFFDWENTGKLTVNP
ncbi:MAG: lamin tail domain-containing protein, partial [Polyangiaceae bacterium]|nr:lamin tail domain-containing protein [Polyangiaceae bacterium]